MTDMPPLPPLPDGLGPDVDVRMHDLRASDFDSTDDMLRQVVRNVEEALDSRGWDQPDWFSAINALRSDDTSGTAFLWISEVSVPAPLHGDLSRILPSLAATLKLSVAVPPLRQALVEGILGYRPDQSFPIGIVASFEGWGYEGRELPDDVREAVERGELHKHPDAREQRHVITRMWDGTTLHLVRERNGGEPAFIAGTDPEHPIVELLAVVADALCTPPAPPCPN